MSLTFSGPLFIVLGLGAFLFQPRKLAYCILFFAPFSATAVINFTSVGYKSGGVGVTVATLFLLLLLAAQLFYGFAFEEQRASRGHLLQVAAIATFWLECIASLMVHSAVGGVIPFQITQLVYLSASIIITLMLSFEFTRDGALEMALRVLRASTVFACLWGLFQKLCSILGVPYPDFIFNNSLSDAADMFDQNIGGVERIASVAVEPSVFAAAMLHFCAFGVTILLYEKRLRTWEWCLPVGITLGTLIICTSTTGYFGLAVLALLLLVQRPKSMILFGVPVIVAAAVAFAASPAFQEAIMMVTVDKSSTSSYMERTDMMLVALHEFQKSPFFGGGWGVVPNGNAITTLLGSVGIVGSLLAFTAGGMTLFELAAGSKGLADGPNWKLAAYAAGARNSLLVSFCCAVSSGLKYVFPDDACFLAIAIALTSRLAIAQSEARASIKSASLTTMPSPSSGTRAQVGCELSVAG